MTLYFLLHDADAFTGQFVPALAMCGRQRNFGASRGYLARLADAADAFATRYHLGSEVPLVRRALAGLPFDHDRWRLLVGESLFFAAVELPDFQTAPEALGRLLGDPDPPDARPPAAPIRQALYGTRDLTFGGIPYRPDHAGWNDAADVARLADYLRAIDPDAWTTAALEGLPGLETAADRIDELAWARERFADLRGMYEAARVRGLVVVCEVL